MTHLDATPADLRAAILDAAEHGDEPAVRALVVALAQVDQPGARELVRSAEFVGWCFRNYRQRWIA